MSSEAALKAFDNCPNRTTREEDFESFSVCVRYPEGFELPISSIFSYDSVRSQLAQKLGCVACPYKNRLAKPEGETEIFEGFHASIIENCKPKFEAGHYDDAVLTGILVVRDRLRELTGFETAAEAFGRGGLVIAGSANEHTDNNFQEGSRFIMMANDRFRNELAHTNDQNDIIKDPNYALQFIGMSSISAYMLDGATVSPPQA
ncbi:MAG TPA: TIGR02391 family protein [Methylomirabilota bacterium]|nr:TIGR02391 family protein [Methylomirabilota bacterium]